MPHYTDWPEYPTALLDITDYPDQTDNDDDVLAWLVNALKHEMIAVQKELGTLPKGIYADVAARLAAGGGAYTDRGDPAAFDFTLANLTTDFTWRDLNLSAIVPAGAKAINIWCMISDDVINSSLELRKKGNTNIFNKAYCVTQVANLYNNLLATVACDTNRIIQYRATNTTWTYIGIIVCGWWL